MEKIKVTQPKDLPPVELKPFPIETVNIPKPDPPKIDVSWGDLLSGIWRKGSEHDLNQLNKDQSAVFWPAIFALLARDWWKLALTIAVPVLIWAGVKIFG